MARVKRLFKSILSFIFVTIPVWLYRNVIREAVSKTWNAFERVIRKNALLVTFGSVFFLLVYFEQQEALHILLTTAVLVIGFKVMCKGLKKK